MKEDNNMTVKDIFKFIHLNEKVSIIDKKDCINSWSGSGQNIPLRFCECEVIGINTEPLANCDSRLVITI